MNAAQRAAGLEKMARAFLNHNHPESPDTIVSRFVNDKWQPVGPMWKVEYLDGITAALAAWEAHAEEIVATVTDNNPTCDHKHYSFSKHGRACTCGTMMTDFGD